MQLLQPDDLHMHSGLREWILRPVLRGLQQLSDGLRMRGVYDLCRRFSCRHMPAELRQWDVRTRLRRGLHDLFVGLLLSKLTVTVVEALLPALSVMMPVTF
jgi:hypothetical protein